MSYFFDDGGLFGGMAQTGAWVAVGADLDGTPRLSLAGMGALRMGALVVVEVEGRAGRFVLLKPISGPSVERMAAAWATGNDALWVQVVARGPIGLVQRAAASIARKDVAEVPHLLRGA